MIILIWSFFFLIAPHKGLQTSLNATAITRVWSGDPLTKNKAMSQGCRCTCKSCSFATHHDVGQLFELSFPTCDCFFWQERTKKGLPFSRSRTVSVGQFYVTRSELDRNTFGNSSVCREYTHPRDPPAAYPKGSIGVDTKFGPELEVIVTKKRDMDGGREQHRFHGKRWNGDMGSHQQRHWAIRHRVRCWSRRLHARCNILSAWGNPKQGRCIEVSMSSTIDDAPIPMEQRRWVYTPGVLRVDDACSPVSKKMTNLLCHNPKSSRRRRCCRMEPIASPVPEVFLRRRQSMSTVRLYRSPWERY